MKLSRLIITLTLLLCTATASAQRIGMGYWDVDHLYDTLPSPFYDDSDYLPQGALKWNTERYLRKVENTAQVIDSLSLPLIALWGVENEEVVRDITSRCKGDYTYLHRTLNSLDGLDFALLYYGDVFLPTLVRPGNRFLYIEGLLRRRTPAPRLKRARRGVVRTRTDTLSLLLTAEHHLVNTILDEIRKERPTFKVVVMGNFDPRGAERYGVRCSAPDAQNDTPHYGNTTSRFGWKPSDYMAADTTFRIVKNEVYIRDFLIDTQSGQPLKTYNKKLYIGGYGKSLPTYLYIE